MNKKKASLFKTGILFGVAILLATGLYVRMSAMPTAAHHRYVLLLQQLHAVCDAMDSEILASNRDSDNGFKTLDQHIAKSRELLAALFPPPSYLPAKHLQQLMDSGEKLRARLQAKGELVVQFKRQKINLQNATAAFINNSEAFLRLRSAGAIRSAIEQYVRAILAYRNRPDAAADAAAKKAAAQLHSAVVYSTAKDFARTLAADGDTILQQTPRVAATIAKIRQITEAATLEKFSALYLEGHEAMAKKLRFWQRLGYALSVVFLFYAALSLMRLHRARQLINQKNEELYRRQNAQKRAENMLRLHDAAFLNAHEGITLTDLKGTIIDVNPAFTRITGYSRSEVIGRNPRVLKSGRHDKHFYAAMWKSIQETGSWRGEIWNRGKFGDIYPELLSISMVPDLTGKPTNYVAVFSDISRLKEQEKQLAEMAYYDALTGLPNRVLLIDRANQAIALSGRNNTLMAVCYLDLDGFKPVNDTWGHSVGDLVLTSIADRLGAQLRSGDTVARLGGDEFVLLLTNLESVEECEAAILRVLKVVAEPLSVVPETISLSGSIGVTIYPNDNSDVDTLLRHADQAMYQAKQAGRGRFYIFNPDRDAHPFAKNDVVERFAQALENNELVLFYQPQVDLRSGEAVGVEALIRWQHPESGLLTPAHFLPAVENDPLMIKVGDWIIQQALAQIESWLAQGIDLPISVNVAAIQLQHSDFVSNLGTLLQKYPAGKNRLSLEVVESTALEDMVKVSRIIEECAQLGIAFALDDFGTGYSSLTYLKRLSASTIKIDQSFVREILVDVNNLIIVQGVLSLSRAFQRSTIAEGIEGMAEGKVLLQIGCTLGQGFGIARPMPAADIPAWLHEWEVYPEWAEVASRSWNDDVLPVLAAKIGHKNWLDQLLFSVRNHNMVTHRNIADYRHCPFGKWYYQQHNDIYKDTAEFRAIETPHQKLHETAQKMDTLLRDGHLEKGNQLLTEIIAIHEELAAALEDFEQRLSRECRRQSYIPFLN